VPVKILIGILALWAISSTYLIFFFHETAKDSFKQVGFNDGVIHAKLKIIETFNTQFKGLSNCLDVSNKEQFAELFSVKATSIYARKNKKGYYELCVYK
jgi:hypothetical protein